MPKQLFIKTFGCQMNELDTEKIAGTLSDLGYSLTDSPDKADMIILNTCSVREKAEYKCYSDLGRLRELKKENPDLIIGVGGCVAQQEGERIVEKAPYVDMVFGTDNISDIPKLLGTNRGKLRNKVSTGRRRAKYARNVSGEVNIPIKRSNPVKAWVNIVDGCDKFCTFCVVPHTRGRERSRQPDDICREIRGLAAAGLPLGGHDLHARLLHDAAILAAGVLAQVGDVRAPVLVATAPDGDLLGRLRLRERWRNAQRNSQRHEKSAHDQ